MRIKTENKRNRIVILIAIVVFLLLGVGVLLFWEIKTFIVTDKTATTVEEVAEGDDLVESASDVSEDSEKKNQEETESESLSDMTDYFPSNLFYGKALPETILTDSNGKECSLQEKYKGRNLVIMFWGSWCPYCKEQLENADRFKEVILSYENTELILIDKMDSKKDETVEKAEKYLKDNQIDFVSYYDNDLKIYNSYGLHLIPTTIIVDEKGLVRYMNADVVDDKQLDEALRAARYGYDIPTLSFIEEKMSSEDIIYREYKERISEHPSGHDGLSESQGLMLQYALIKDDKELFNRYADSITKLKDTSGLYAWYITKDGKKAGANSFVDDLRILHMLEEADKKWGGYSQQIKELSEALLDNNKKGDEVYSFYDFKQKKAGGEINLCYGDLEAFSDLVSVNKQWGKIHDNMAKIITEGFISESFPLYYSSYSYKKGEYSKDDLNTAEALIVLYNLAKAGEVRPESVNWLKKEIKNHTLGSRYHINGEVVDGYEYESTAVYAISMLIGYQTGDSELVTLARINMEKSRISDTESPLFGAFTKTDNGSDIIAFDELMPLLAYAAEE